MAALLGLSFVVAGHAQPSVRILVGVAPGGSADMTARITATHLAEVLKRPVIVENKPGANHLIATKSAISSPPDGNTLLFGTVTMTVNPVFYPNETAIDPRRDLTPLSMLFQVNPLVVAVSPGFPVNSMGELIAHARANPGAVNYSIGSSTFRVGAELLLGLTDMKLTYVGYNGVAPALRAIMTGEVQVTFVDSIAALAPIKQGQIKGIAVSAPKRVRVLPDVPSATEAGVPGFLMDGWGALFAPPNTPPAVVMRLSEAIMKAGESPELRNKFSALGLDPVFDTPQQLAERVRRDATVFQDVLRKANVRLD
jgi:tripartite-type tricarboxylate transporter receptor subunit TctC